MKCQNECNNKQILQRRERETEREKGNAWQRGRECIVHLKYTFTAKTFVANTFDLHPKESAKKCCILFCVFGATVWSGSRTNEYAAPAVADGINYSTLIAMQVPKLIFNALIRITIHLPLTALIRDSHEATLKSNIARSLSLALLVTL